MPQFLADLESGTLRVVGLKIFCHQAGIVSWKQKQTENVAHRQPLYQNLSLICSLKIY